MRPEYVQVIPVRQKLRHQSAFEALFLFFFYFFYSCFYMSVYEYPQYCLLRQLLL